MANAKCPRYYELVVIFGSRPSVKKAAVCENGSDSSSIDANILNGGNNDPVIIGDEPTSPDSASDEGQVSEEKSNEPVEGDKSKTATEGEGGNTAEKSKTSTRNQTIKEKISLITGGKGNVQARGNNKRDFLEMISGYFNSRSDEIELKKEDMKFKLEVKKAKQKRKLLEKKMETKMKLIEQLRVEPPTSDLYQILLNDVKKLTEDIEKLEEEEDKDESTK